MAEEFKGIVRLGDRDINGNVPVRHALTLVRGVGFMLANAIFRVLKLDNKKIGDLTSDELKKVEQVIRNPTAVGIPIWMVNRRRDPETGGNLHLFSSDLVFQQKSDIRLMKKIKSYRGMRHARGDKGLKLKVRGQRTKSTGRKNRAIGVKRKKE